MFTCENCNKLHDGLYATGRFCSSKCAKSFSSKFTKDKTKMICCDLCGKETEISIKSKNTGYICETCKSKNVVKCKICGSLYRKGDKCNNSFCQHHNIQQFKNLIKYFHFNESKLGTKDVENEFNKIRNNLYNLYWNEHMSSTEICKLFNYTSGAANLQKIFKNILYIPSKTSQEAIKENYLYNRKDVNVNTVYNNGWHTTWNNKKIFYRSSYELRFAEELDNKQIDYEVEYLRIIYFDTQKHEYRCAIPDFYIPAENLIVEIKSCWTLDKQNMKDKMKAYKDLGYNTKCICDFKEIQI